VQCHGKKKAILLGVMRTSKSKCHITTITQNVDEVEEIVRLISTDYIGSFQIGKLKSKIL